MTCRIHDASLAGRLAEALLRATETLIGERDCLADSICGGPVDPDDEAMLAEYDAEIDGYLDLLAEAGLRPRDGGDGARTAPEAGR